MNDTISPDAETGLRADQVAQKRAQGRQNVLDDRATKSTAQILKDNVCTLFNLFNLLIAAALALVGAWSNLLFLLVVALNTLIGIAQEVHAKHLVEKLSLLSLPTARVIRDGAPAEIPTQDLVEEDVIELEAGRQVCADAVLLTGAAEVNESLLTGESDPVRRSAGEHLLSGSFVVSGRCRARVEHVGRENYAARIAQEAKALRGVRSELLTSMRKVTRFTGYWIPFLGVLLFLEALFLRGDPVQDAVVATSAGLLGMLPKGLVLLTSVSLAAGIIALSRRRVLVQELYALETLAHVDTLCLDKTGTLTQGAMRVEEVRLTALGRAEAFEEKMGAFLHASQDNNATFQALQARFPARSAPEPLERIPFSAERKWSAVRFADYTFVVGAPERLAGPGEQAEKRAAFRAGRRVLLAGLADGPVRADPIRPDAAETLAYFQREGVQRKLLSGDNPEAGAALAAQAGFPEADRCLDMTGVTSEADIERAAQTHSIFGRVSPAQKKQLVQALQRQGHFVAMTGDGVNDLPALRQADCSIAMGTGSDAARQAAQVVLLDSDFAALPDVLYQGRRVVNNITRVGGIFLVKTVYSVLLSAVCILCNLPFPLVPIQVTWMDLVIEGFPSFLLSFAPDGRRISGRFLPTALRRALPNAAAILVCFLVNLALRPALPIPPAQMQTLLFLLVGAVGMQAVCKACWPLNGLRALLCAATAAGFFAGAVLLRGVLHTVPLDAPAALLLLSLALLSFLVERAFTALLRRGGALQKKETCRP